MRGQFVTAYRKRERESKEKGNVSIDIRKADTDASFLSMTDLAALVDKRNPLKEACLLRDSYEYKPVRDALAHTAFNGRREEKTNICVSINIRGDSTLFLN
jgi:hypothetical protein